MTRGEALAILTEGLGEPPGGWRDELTPDAAGLDSVLLVDRLFRIEEASGVRLPANLGRTLGDLLDAVERAAPP